MTALVMQFLQELNIHLNFLGGCQFQHLPCLKRFNTLSVHEKILQDIGLGSVILIQFYHEFAIGTQTIFAVYRLSCKKNLEVMF